MPDPQSRARDGDRKRAVEQVDAAYADGRITAADRALRVENIESAQTLGELDLVVRDLRSRPQQQPEPTQPRPTQSHAPQPGPQPTWAAGEQAFSPSQPRRTGSCLTVGLVVVVVAIVTLAAVGSFLVSLVGGADDAFDDFPGDGPVTNFSPTDDSTDPKDDPTDTGSPTADRLALTEAGLRWFVGRYGDEFGSTRALGVTIWADRASIELPVQGGRRFQRWAYGDGVFEQLGSTTTNARGAKVVDLRRLRIKPLVANIRRAKRTLGIEKPETIYVIIADDTLGDQPEARIYVTNEYNESGYLATTFDGRVVRSFPFEG